MLPRTFFSEVPLAALWAVLIARIFVSDSSKFSNKARSLDDTSAYMSPVGTSLWLTVDWLGAITFAASITLALSILTMGGKKLPWSDPATVSLFIAAGSSALAFLLVERFVAAKPLISLKLLKTNGVGVFCGLQVLLMASRFGVSVNNLSRSAVSYHDSIDQCANPTFFCSNPTRDRCGSWGLSHTLEPR